jgi:hypothetical protein
LGLRRQSLSGLVELGSLEQVVQDDAIEQLRAEIASIKDRNERVEADKAWERSAVRIGTICGITYITATILLAIIGSKNCYLDALVPVAGFFLSTQSLPAIKEQWLSRRMKNGQK